MRIIIDHKDTLTFNICAVFPTMTLQRLHKDFNSEGTTIKKIRIIFKIPGGPNVVYYLILKIPGGHGPLAPSYAGAASKLLCHLMFEHPVVAFWLLILLLLTRLLM